MEKEKIDRINELAKKAKNGGLTPEETEEQATLRNEYLAAVRANLRSQLSNAYTVDDNGKEIPLQKKILH